MRIKKVIFIVQWYLINYLTHGWMKTPHISVLSLDNEEVYLYIYSNTVLKIVIPIEH